MNSIQPLYRSILFVPGSEQKRIDKAATIAADALVFDLEDAVSPTEKSRARDIVIEALDAAEFKGRQIIVRVNGITSPWFKEDIETVVAAGNCSVMLPKCQSPEDLLQVRAYTKEMNVPVFAIIETAKAVLALGDISKNLSESDALCFGHVDFATDMGLPEAASMTGIIYHARCQVSLTAAAFAVSAIDNVCLDVRDETVIREDALAGLRLGYAGKLCIHPNQVPIVNEVYTPTQAQVSKANEILAAWVVAKEQGQGVFSFENKMVDLPVIQAQEKILKLHAAATNNINVSENLKQ